MADPSQSALFLPLGVTGAPVSLLLALGPGAPVSLLLALFLALPDRARDRGAGPQHGPGGRGAGVAEGLRARGGGSTKSGVFVLYLHQVALHLSN